MIQKKHQCNRKNREKEEEGESKSAIKIRKNIRKVLKHDLDTPESLNIKTENYEDIFETIPEISPILQAKKTLNTLQEQEEM